MTQPCVLGIDIGTSSCKACVVDFSGRRSSSCSVSYATRSPHDGWSEQDPSDWITALSNAVRGALERKGRERVEVRALALTSAAHIGVLVDGNDRPVRPALLWNDQRSAAEADRISQNHGRLIFEQTYNEISPAWTAAHLAWIRANDPIAWDKTRRVYLSKDYVIRRLTGESCTDPATAVASLLYHVERNEWSPQICALVGLSTDVLPPVRRVDEVVGTLTRRAAEELHLVPGIPVINGTLDSATETWAAGAVSPGDCVIRLGSAGGVHLVWSSMRAIRGANNYPHPDAPLWYSQAGTNAAATSIDWIRSVLGRVKALDFDQFTHLLKSASAGSEGLMFHPFLAGERSPYWNSEIRGGYTGLSFRHGPAEFARAVVEGVCYSLRDAFTVFDSLNPTIGEVSVVGGGTANPEWLKILSAVFGQPLTALTSADSAYGAALLAIRAHSSELGSERQEAVIKSDGAKVAEPNTRPLDLDLERARIEPDPDLVSVYQKGFVAYREAAQRLLEYHAVTPASED